MLGQVTYLNAEYDDFCEAISGGTPLNGDPLCSTPTYADRSGNRLNLAPEWSGGVSLDYRTRVADAGELSFNLGYAWEDTSYFTAANEAIVSTGGWERMDGRVGFALNDGLEVYLRQEPDRRTIRRPRAPWTADARAKSRQRSSYLRAGSSLSVLTHYRRNRHPCGWARGVIRMRTCCRSPAGHLLREANVCVAFKEKRGCCAYSIVRVLARSRH